MTSDLIQPTVLTQLIPDNPEPNTGTVSDQASTSPESKTEMVDSLITQAVKESQAQTSTNDASSVDYAKLFPDGHTFTDDEVKLTADLFQKLTVSESQAKSILDFQKSLVESAVKTGIDSHVEKTKSDWLAKQTELQVKTKDKFGSEYKNIMATIPQAINRFCDKSTADSLLQYFDDTGIGSDPRMIEFMSKLGKTVSEDKPMTGQAISTTIDWFPGSGLK